jgi:hypothetical protein
MGKSNRGLVPARLATAPYDCDLPAAKGSFRPIPSGSAEPQYLQHWMHSVWLERFACRVDCEAAFVTQTGVRRRNVSCVVGLRRGLPGLGSPAWGGAECGLNNDMCLFLFVSLTTVRDGSMLGCE